ILRCHPQQGLDNQALKDLTKLLNKFQKNMQVHLNNENPAKGMENARKELARFNGALANLLEHHAVVANRGEAIQAINFVRDYLWKKDMCTPSCVIEKMASMASLKCCVTLNQWSLAKQRLNRLVLMGLLIFGMVLNLGKLNWLKQLVAEEKILGGLSSSWVTIWKL
ncbi:hypothetical protein, partial [Legionella tunisiensis]|uniref:hypothetical protein n=1 Tax=Legionella tunisiensis TaxID=1034944 RepID=UPI001E50E8DF